MGSRRLNQKALGVLVALFCLAGSAGWAQQYGSRLGTIQRGGKVTFEPAGPGVLFDALDPALRKWYVPQELYAEYRWRQWEYSNYARQNYQRYVSTSIEGDYWYDVYGNLLTRGWLLYDWRQENPQPFGSALEKTLQYSRWFNNLVVASDHKGEYHYAMTVGNEIRTTLTPMTFSKPLFNGVQWDFASDKYAATMLLSRISDPGQYIGNVDGPESYTSNTNLFAGRLEAQVGDFAKVGGTFVNAHHSQSQLEALNGDIFKGALTSEQNAASVSRIYLRISDDSPLDGEGGGALFSSDIIIHDLRGETFRGSTIGFRPRIEGGLQRHGYLAADGTEEILLTYDFNDPSYEGPHPTEVVRVQLELVLANDYLVEMASNRQLNSARSIVYLPIARAHGNVLDGSNQRILVFDYGLPTANQITGVTVELTDLHGLRGYLEINVNDRYRQYPNPNVERHRAASARSTAWMLNLSKRAYPAFWWLEAYSVQRGYTTTFTTTGADGDVNYGGDYDTYEFVDDNDDMDRRPDWRRKGWGSGDDEVYPGWDENNDFVSDFNQNDNDDSPNLIPDYEEPFLRYHTDRPEFLYGIDANHNGTIDRFENDEEPDYPYRRDQQGYNTYVGTFLGPDIRVTGGRMRVEQLSDRRHSRAWYALLTMEKGQWRWGRLRAFQDLRRVRDTIRDDLIQWQQPANARGTLRAVADELPAQDTWIATSWWGLDQNPVEGLRLSHKLKWQSYWQRDNRLELELRGQRRQSFFLGLIDKADYTTALGSWLLSPRWKSEYRRERPVTRISPQRRELTELLMLVGRRPFMRRSYLQTGVEYEWFRQLRDPVPPGANPSYTALTTTVQVTNVSDYLGYQLTTNLGFEITRRNLDFEPKQYRTRGFIAIYAGVDR